MHPCMQVPEAAEEDVRSLRMAVTGSCKPNICAGNQNAGLRKDKFS